MKIWEYLSKIKCPKCDNRNIEKLELYFVGDREVPEKPIVITKYISCLVCDSVFKVDDVDHTKDFLLEPVVEVGG